jgi:hypothetical protein
MASRRSRPESHKTDSETTWRKIGVGCGIQQTFTTTSQWVISLLSPQSLRPAPELSTEKLSVC